MDRSEVLKLAVGLAMENGFEIRPCDIIYKNAYFPNHTENKIVIEYYLSKDQAVPCSAVFNLYELLFSHNFARALWGKECRVYKNGHWMKCEPTEELKSDSAFFMRDWEYHLQQMVTQTDPFKYIKYELRKRVKNAIRTF